MIIFWIALLLVVSIGFTAFFGAPYVPSLNKEVKAAFKELYPLSSNDVVVDLGSGDGSVLLEAAGRGASVVGVELNPFLTFVSRLRIGGKGIVVNRNMWRYELPTETSLVYVFTVSRDLDKLETYLQQQADSLGRPLSVMTFGASFKTRKPTKSRNAHSLYIFAPLQA